MRGADCRQEQNSSENKLLLQRVIRGWDQSAGACDATQVSSKRLLLGRASVCPSALILAGLSSPRPMLLPLSSSRCFQHGMKPGQGSGELSLPRERRGLSSSPSTGLVPESLWSGRSVLPGRLHLTREGGAYWRLSPSPFSPWGTGLGSWVGCFFLSPRYAPSLAAAARECCSA